MLRVTRVGGLKCALFGACCVCVFGAFVFGVFIDFCVL